MNDIFQFLSFRKYCLIRKIAMNSATEVARVWTVYFMMTLYFSLVVLSYKTCRLGNFDTEELKPPWYLINNTIPVPSFVLGRTIYGNTIEPCTIDVTSVVLEYRNRSDTEVFMIGFYCPWQQNVIFSNLSEAKLHLKTYSVLGVLFIQDCRVNVNNVRNLMEIARFYIAQFRDTNHSTTTNRPAVENSQECSGMDYLASLTLKNVFPSQTFMKYLHHCNTSYPSMVEIVFSTPDIEMHNLSEFVSEMYPNIQSVNLPNNGWKKIPNLKLAENIVFLPNDLFMSPFSEARYKGTSYLQFPLNTVKKVINLSGNRISSVPSYAFDGIIYVISIENNVVNIISERAFWNVKGLQVLRLKGNKITTLPELLLANQSSLVYIDVSKNFIVSIHPRIFTNSPNLKYVDLSYNYLAMLPDGLFQANKYLHSLNIDFNNISFVPDNILPTSNSALQYLSIRNNSISSLPIIIFYQRNLEIIRLNNNKISWIDLSRVAKRIDIDKFSVEITATTETNVKISNILKELDLSNNEIKSVSVGSDQKLTPLFLKYLFSYYDISLTGNPIRCDCGTMTLIKIVNNLIDINQLDKDIPMKMRWICTKPTELAGKLVFNLVSNPDRLYCRLPANLCPVNCQCYRRFISDIRIVDCTKKKMKFIPNILLSTYIEIRISENRITTIPLAQYSKSVLYLDVSRNSLRTIDRNVFLEMTNLTYLDVSYNLLTSLPDTLQQPQLQSLRISNNPYRCDCNTKWLRNWLDEKANIVQDAPETSCSAENRTGRRMMQVDESEFVCRTMQKEYLTMWIYINHPYITFAGRNYCFSCYF